MTEKDCVALLAEVERLRAALEKVRTLASGPGALDSRYAAIAANALGVGRKGLEG